MPCRGRGGVLLCWTGAKMGKNRPWETEKYSYMMNPELQVRSITVQVSRKSVEPGGYCFV